MTDPNSCYMSTHAENSGKYSGGTHTHTQLCTHRSWWHAGACTHAHTHTQTHTCTRENRELIQSRVMLTATLLFLKGTLHKISSPHHLSSGIFVYLHNTLTHTHTHVHVRKHCTDTQKHSHTHAHTVGVNVPSPRICVSKQFKLVKKKNWNGVFFNLSVVEGEGRFFSLFGHDSIFTTFSDLFLVLFMDLIIKVRPPTGQSTQVLFTLLNLQVICNLALIFSDVTHIIHCSLTGNRCWIATVDTDSATDQFWVQTAMYFLRSWQYI